MNDFYKQPKALVWIESILFLLAGFFLAVLIIEKGSGNPVFYAAFILYVPISQFLYTPIFKLTGGYTWLYGERETDRFMLDVFPFVIKLLFKC